MARKKKAKSFLPEEGSAYIEFDAAYLVQRLALFKGILLKRAVRKDCMSYHFTAATDGKVTVAVTNLQESLLLKLDTLRVTGAGTVMVDAAALNALLGAFSEPRFRLHLENADQVHAGYTRTKMLVPAYDPKDLTATAAPSLTNTAWIVRGRELALALGVLDKSRDPQSTRYCLGGVAMVFPPPEEGISRVELVATDGRRLTRYWIPVKPLGENPDRLVRPATERNAGLPMIPDRAVAVTKKLAALAGENSVALCVIPGQAKDLQKEEFEPGSIQVVTKNEVLTATMPEGRFPMYQEVFPTGEPLATITLDDASRLGVLVTSALAAADTDCKGLDITAAGGAVMIEAGGGRKGKIELSAIDIEMEGRFSVSLDAAFLRDLFVMAGQDRLKIKFFNKQSAVIFECGEWFEYALMPLSTDNYTPPKKTDVQTEVSSEDAEAAPEPGSGANFAPLPEPEPAKKPRRGRKPKDEDKGGSAPVDPEPKPQPLTPVGATAGIHERNGRAKPKRRPRPKK